MYNAKNHWNSYGVSKKGEFRNNEISYDLPDWDSDPNHYNLLSGLDKILDIGSGNGLQVGKLKARGIDSYGVDIADKLLKAARKNCKEHGVNPTFKEWDGVTLPFEDGFFDAVMTNTVLQHIVNDQSCKIVFNEAFRVLKPGGILITGEMVGPKDVRLNAHVKLRTKKTYKEYSENAGFSQSYIRRVFNSNGTIFNLIKGEYKESSGNQNSIKRRTKKQRGYFNKVCKLSDKLLGSIVPLDHVVRMEYIKHQK